MKRLTLLLVGCATMAGQPASAQDVIRACAGDAQKLCAGVPNGGGRIVACLREHKDALSNQCKQAAGVAANSGNGPAPSAANTSPPAAAKTADAPAAAPAAPVAAPKPSASAAKDTPVPGAYLRMKQVQIVAHVVDAKLGPGTVDLPALDLLIPSTWDFKGGVVGNTVEGCFRDLYAMSWEATSPDGSVAFQGALNDSWQYADDPAVLKRLNDPTRRQIGLGGKPCPVSKPVSADEYLRKHMLPQLPSGTTLVSIEPFPALDLIARKQLGLPPGDTGSRAGIRTDAIRARTEFQKDGKPVETWLTVVVVTRTYTQGRGTFYDCRAIDAMALRAEKGKLDQNDKLFRVLIASTRPEAKWQAYSNAEIAKFYELEAKKQANMDAIWAAFNKHAAEVVMGEVAYQQQGSYNAAFGADQGIRGVQTYVNPRTGGTMELSNLYDHAWLNGTNEYIMSEDPNFDPNGRLSGSWDQLQVVQASALSHLDRDKYRNFAELIAAEPADAFSISMCDRASQVVVAAPHGGGIEPGTSEIAVAIAGADLSYYLFEGHKRQSNAALHITSCNFDEPRGLALLRRADCVLTVHGESSEAETVYLGGLNAPLKLALTGALQTRGYVVRECANLQGLDERNICNIGLTAAGVQLEISAGLRRSFFESLSRAGRANPTARLAEFSAIVREAVH